MKQKQSLLFTKQNLHTPWHEFPCCSCLTTISAKFCTRHDSYTVVTCVTLSWRVQNFVVISRVHFKPEHCKFWSSLVRTPVALCWLWSCSASKAAIGVGTMLVQCRHCRPNIGPTRFALCVDLLTHCDLVTSCKRQGSRSTLAQVMACCLMAPSHYLNQCWLIRSVRSSGIHLRAIS